MSKTYILKIQAISYTHVQSQHQVYVLDKYNFRVQAMSNTHAISESGPRPIHMLSQNPGHVKNTTVSDGPDSETACFQDMVGILP